jgi:hypothetical protein
MNRVRDEALTESSLLGRLATWWSTMAMKKLPPSVGDFPTV